MTTERAHDTLTFHSTSDGTDSERERDTDSVQASLPRSAGSGLHAPVARSASFASRARAGTGHSSRSGSGISSGHTMHAPTVSVSPPPHSSSTHAGGILPSASFFHPSRPTFYTDFGAPGFGQTTGTMGVLSMPSISRAVELSNTRPESTGSESFAQTSDEASGYASGRDRAGSTATSNGAHIGSVSRSFSTKVSREPLLPIGQKPKPTVAGPPVARNTSVRKLPGIGSTTKWTEGSAAKSTESGSTGGRVRTSVEKFLRKTLSGDAQMMEELEHSGSLSATIEETQARPRAAEEPYTEFKAISPISNSKAYENTATMDIARNGNTYGPPSFRIHPPGHRFKDFDAVPPNENPPLSRKPVFDESGKPVQKYKLHPSRNTFLLSGKLLTGGDSVWPFVSTLILLLGVSGAWLGTTAVWWWKNESPAVAIIGAYMCLMTLANMLATAFSDPGILPRNLDPDPPYPNTNSTETTRVPIPRELKIRSGVVRVKYCQTCRIYRPPRSSHCRLCDNCVDGCDHHCQWVNNCVGRRNYTTFILLLVSATLTLCLIICTAALQLVIEAHADHLTAAESLRRGAGSAVVFVLSAIVIWPVAGLLGYHMRLLLLNLTTIEQIRNSAHKSLGSGPPPPNPFAMGNWRRNLGEMLCRTQGASWLSAGELATEDRREPNPGSEIRE